MNRMGEYRALLEEMEETPARLNFTVARAKARTARQKLRRAVGVPASALAVVCLCFVLLVNVSAPFAAACSGIPVLKDLAQAVSFNPSLSAAVENDWVQPIGLTQSANGAEMTIEYVIVDQKQLNIFYTTGGDAAPMYDVYADVQGAGGTGLSGFCVLKNSARENGELQTITVDFTERSMPGELRLVCRLFPLKGTVGESIAPSHVSDAEEDAAAPAATLTFDLSFDPKFTQQATVVKLDRWVELDGQRILFRDVEIYPTHIRVNVEDDPDNTAWLRRLEFYAEDENGGRYERPSGITATGSPDSPAYRSFRLDSAYFADSEGLTLCLTGATWLDKDKEWTWVDLDTGAAGFLPEGVSLRESSREGEDVSLIFRVRNEPRGNLVMSWRLPGGEKRNIGSWGYTTGLGEESEVHILLNDCPGGRVELELDDTRTLEYETPVEIPIS